MMSELLFKAGLTSKVDSTTLFHQSLNVSKDVEPTVSLEKSVSGFNHHHGDAVFPYTQVEFSPSDTACFPF